MLNQSITLPPRVSVVIPAFNAARYIRDAIDSVLEQTLENREIIVVDDGSADDLRAVLGVYGEHIRYLPQPNSGVSTARNRGIEAARGEFVAFLDADDYFLCPTKLEEQIVRFDSQPQLSIVHTGWRVADENGTVVVDKMPWIHAPVLDLKNWLLFQPVMTSAMMFRRNPLVSVGGFDPQLRHLEDIDLALRLSLQGYAAAWVEKVTVAYRRHGENASLAITSQDTALCTVLDKFFAQPGLPDEIRDLERRVRYSSLVWIAYKYYRARCYAEMARCLLQSLRYAALSTSATFLDWIDRFRVNHSEDIGLRLSVFDLTELDEWQKMVRSQLIGITPDEAFFPSSGKEFPMDWSLPRTPRSFSGAQPENAAFAASDIALPSSTTPTYPADIDLTRALEKDYGRHRSGWLFALQSLKELHHSGGVLIDAFVEHSFDQAGGKPQVAYQEPWIGFLHNPPGIPPWFIHNQSPQSLLSNQSFQKSLSSCAGLFCLSEYHRRWLEKCLKLPIVSLLHPTAVVDETFSIDNFLDNPDKKIVQIGSWLRKLHSIYYLPVTRLRRAIVHQHLPYIKNLFAAEKKEYQLDPDYGVVEVLGFLSDSQYDDLLSRNIVYLDLYDSSANNTIIECIVRSTPILVNPLPAVREYLGEDYPFYFSSRNQAARKAEDVALIEETHRYLKAHPIKEKLTPSFFLKSIAESEIYKNVVSVS